MELKQEVLNTIKCYMNAELSNDLIIEDDGITILLKDGTKAKITVR